MTDQTNLWQGPFGDAYQDRNAPSNDDIANREKWLEYVFKTIYSVSGAIPKSALEIGAGQGPNMAALERLSLRTQNPIKLYATEINQKARIKLSENVKDIEILDSIPSEPIADLVFCYGVMIHTHPAHIRDLQTKMHKASKRWLLCAEYFAPQTRPIMYRGEKDALWLDDYGSLFVNNFALRLVGYGFAWKKVTGLDNVTYWIFERAEKMI